MCLRVLSLPLFSSLLLTLSFALIPLLFLPEYILKTVLQCSLCFKITVYFTRYDLIRALIMFSAA